MIMIAASSLILHHYLPFLFCLSCRTVACGWCRVGFSVFIYSSINTAQACHGFPLAGGTAWQDSCF